MKADEQISRKIYDDEIMHKVVAASDEPFVKVVPCVSEIYDILSNAKISEDLISCIIHKVKEREVVVAVIKSKVLIGFVSPVLNDKGELENIYTTFSISKVDKKSTI